MVDAPPEENISFFLDWKDKQGAARFLFDHTKNEKQLKWRNRLGSISFGHKEFDVPDSVPLLQVADIAAVEVRKAIGNPITHPHLPERKSLARLKEAGNVYSIRYLDGPALKSLYELKRKHLGLPNNAEEAELELRKRGKIIGPPRTS
jgi:hypothetical protein